jgi:uncharacterized protein (DUF2235 family)
MNFEEGDKFHDLSNLFTTGTNFMNDGPKQRLVVLFDGTWNDHHKETNVYRLARSIEDYDGSIPQSFFYDPGVGTSYFEKRRGGLLGYGLSENLRQGYDWLARKYREGDEIYLFGFSRGAYTARSLAGMINKCGLIDIVTPALIAEAEALYRSDATANDPKCVEFRMKYTTPVKIRMIGVWDTVGALGIPHTIISERGFYKFHDTRLSDIVENGFQALALDEHRGLYDAVLWTGQAKPEQNVEQSWFIGAHANVGGGYPDDPLAKISFQWMQEKAESAGLRLRKEIAPADAFLADPADSFRKSFGGWYALLSGIFRKGDGRHYRYFGRNATSSKEGDGNAREPAVNVSVHPSVIARLKADSAYRPKTLENAGLIDELLATE